MVIHLNGRITDAGELELDLPLGLPAGEARITIEISTQDLDSALQTTPMTGAEIVKAGLVGGWENADIDNSARWVEEQRKKRRKPY
jgi:hypothetical protein